MDEVVARAPRAWRVLVITDHSLLAEGIACILERETAYSTQLATSTLKAAQVAKRWRPDVVVAQAGHGDASALGAIREFRDGEVTCPVIVMSADEAGEFFLVALGEGARGFLGPDADAEALVRSITEVIEGRLAIGEYLVERLALEYITKLHGRRTTVRGQSYVTDRELEILRELSHGMTNGAIARKLFLSENTVRSHVRSIALKLDAENRVHAVARAVNLGLLAPVGVDDAPLPPEFRASAAARNGQHVAPRLSSHG